MVEKKAKQAGESRRQGIKPEVPLTREIIVGAAMTLLDDYGPDAFSMRALATSLGVYPAALYWHVGNRAKLLGLIGAEWLSEAISLKVDGDWREFVRALAIRYRTAAHAHPNVARLLGHELFQTGQGLRLAEAAISQLHQAGFSDDASIYAYNALAGSITGFIDVELSELHDDNAAAVLEMETELGSLDPERFPNLVRLSDRLVNQAISLRWKSGDEAPLDDSFNFLLDVLIAGLEVQLGQLS